MVERENVLPQSVHRKGRSPVCTRQWSFMWWRSLKALPQNSHLNGRSPVCTGRWVISDDTSGNDLPQNLHSTTPGPSALNSRSMGVGWPPSPSPSPSGGSWWRPMVGRATPPLKSNRDDSAISAQCGNWCCCSRYLRLSSEWERMCRVSLLWCWNVVPQYMHEYTRGEPAASLPSRSCNQTTATSTSCAFCFCLYFWLIAFFFFCKICDFRGFALLPCNTTRSWRSFVWLEKKDVCSSAAP